MAVERTWASVGAAWRGGDLLDVHGSPRATVWPDSVGAQGKRRAWTTVWCGLPPPRGYCVTKQRQRDHPKVRSNHGERYTCTTCEREPVKDVVMCGAGRWPHGAGLPADPDPDAGRRNRDGAAARRDRSRVTRAVYRVVTNFAIPYGSVRSVTNFPTSRAGRRGPRRRREGRRAGRTPERRSERRRVALAVRRGRERTPTVAATRQGSCSRSWRRSGVSHAGHGLSHGRLAVPRAPAARAGSRLLDPIGLCCRWGRYGWQIGAACANNRWQGRAGRCVRRPHERFDRAGGCAEAPRRVYGRWVRR